MKFILKLGNDVWNAFVLKYKRVKIGKSSHIRGRLFVHGKKGAIVVGDDVTIQSSDNANFTSGFNRTHLSAEKNGYIIIGNKVGISNATVVAFAGVTIEDNVYIGSGVKIWDTDFHSLDYETRINKGDTNVKSAPVLIKKGAFIGACTIILKGVTIGEHAIIGAGSVVTKNIPSGEIWAGNPAKCVGKVEGEI